MAILDIAMLRSRLPEHATAVWIYAAFVLSNYAAHAPYAPHPPPRRSAAPVPPCPGPPRPGSAARDTNPDDGPGTVHKVSATQTVAMSREENGQLDSNRTVASYLPEVN